MQGMWSSEIHGVPCIMTKSLVCKIDENDRKMICQETVYDDENFNENSVVTWLLKRWYVFINCKYLYINIHKI